MCRLHAPAESEARADGVRRLHEPAERDFDRSDAQLEEVEEELGVLLLRRNTQHVATQCSALQHDTTRCNTVIHSTTRCNSTRHKKSLALCSCNTKHTKCAQERDGVWRSGQGCSAAGDHLEQALEDTAEMDDALRSVECGPIRMGFASFIGVISE